MGPLAFPLCLRGQSVDLISYESHHVPTYHEWLCDPDLQRLTGTAPTTLQEEIDHQADLQRKFNEFIQQHNEGGGPFDPKGFMCTLLIVDKSACRPCGDVNAVIVEDIDSPSTPPPLIVELMVMVAETSSRRRGIAFESLKLFLSHCIRWFGIRTFVVKIQLDNEGSIRLFEKMGFTRTGVSEEWGEAEYRLEVKQGQDGGEGESVGDGKAREDEDRKGGEK